MTEDQLRELFREMRDEPVPPDSQARVRMAVAARTASWPERLRKYWKPAALILAPAAVILLVTLNRQPTPVDLPAAPVVAAKMLPAEPTATPPPARIVRVRHRVAKSHVAEAATSIRIETEDPDVVILLVGG